MCLLARLCAQTKPDPEDFVVNHGKPEVVEAKGTRNPLELLVDELELLVKIQGNS